MNFFKKDTEKLVAPVDGTCISIEKVSDQVFASKMMGDGFAIIPSSDVIVSPINGQIMMIAETLHAVGVQSKKDEILVHIGIDTVALNGEGFQCMVKTGDTVKAGEPLIRFDRELMEKKKIDMTTMVIFTSENSKNIEEKNYGRQVVTGEVLSR